MPQSERKTNESNKQQNVKTKKIKKIAIISVAIFLVLAIGTGGFFIWMNYQNSYVATVEGNKISKTDYMYYLKNSKINIESKALVQGTTDEKRIFWETKAGSEVLGDALPASTTETNGEALKRLTLEDLRDLTLEYQKALAEDPNAFTTAGPQARQSVLSNLQQNSTTQQDFTTNLTNTFGISFDTYIDIITRQQVASSYISKNTSAIAVTDAEVEAYYNSNKPLLDLITVKEIFYPTIDLQTQAGLSTELQTKAKNDADAAVVKIQNGANIDDIIKNESKDPNLSTNNGEIKLSLDASSQSYYQPISDALATMKAGDVQSVYVDNAGYYVIKYMSITAFADVKDQSKQALQSSKYNEQMRTANADIPIVENNSIVANIDVNKI
jgi:nitrate reductase NapE component